MINTKENKQAEINSQTALIPWKELLRFFARGKTIEVMPYLDLVDVGVEIVSNNQQQITRWMNQQDIRMVTDDTAKKWLDQDVWAVVCKPWVLVQQQTKGDSKIAFKFESSLNIINNN
ncbi:MAG: DUF2288 domain-containing protein [Methylococcales bacterium]|jgi:hypothetical protein|nr:DUF2288 domain-containing protein [Methylococcales bacterium]